MTREADIYIGDIIVAAAVVKARELIYFHCANPVRYASYLLLVMAASAFKVRLPGMRGTYSLGSLGGLFGIIMFTLPETLVAGCAAALVQSVIRAKTKPKLVQVAFNAATIVLTIAMAYGTARLSAAVIGSYPPVVLAITACVYFV